MMLNARRVVATAMLVGLLLGLGGCDWWPPSLQERIGQQDAQIKMLQAENTRLQAKVTELAKAIEESKAKAAQLEQLNSELKTQVEQLKAALGAAEEKLQRKPPPGASKKR